MKKSLLRTTVGYICMVSLFAGCKKVDAQAHVELPPNVDFKNNSPRFKVERVAVIRDDLAYGSARGVYIIHDNDTGKEYMGLSGVGVSELGSHSKMIGKIVTTEPDER